MNVPNQSLFSTSLDVLYYILERKIKSNVHSTLNGLQLSNGRILNTQRIVYLDMSVSEQCLREYWKHLHGWHPIQHQLNGEKPWFAFSGHDKPVWRLLWCHYGKYISQMIILSERCCVLFKKNVTYIHYNWFCIRMQRYMIIWKIIW